MIDSLYILHVSALYKPLYFITITISIIKDLKFDNNSLFKEDQVQNVECHSDTLNIFTSFAVVYVCSSYFEENEIKDLV